MTKSIRILIALVAAAVMALVAGCGAPGAAANHADNFVGVWKITGITEGGETMGAEELDTLAEMGIEIALAFSEDGEFVLALGDEEHGGTWEAKDAATVELIAEGETIKGTLDNGKLTLDQGEDATLTFEKKEG